MQFKTIAAVLALAGAVSAQRPTAEDGGARPSAEPMMSTTNEVTTTSLTDLDMARTNEVTTTGFTGVNSCNLADNTPSQDGQFHCVGGKWVFKGTFGGNPIRTGLVPDTVPVRTGLINGAINTCNLVDGTPSQDNKFQCRNGKWVYVANNSVYVPPRTGLVTDDLMVDDMVDDALTWTNRDGCICPGTEPIRTDEPVRFLQPAPTGSVYTPPPQQDLTNTPLRIVSRPADTGGTNLINTGATNLIGFGDNTPPTAPQGIAVGEPTNSGSSIALLDAPNRQTISPVIQEPTINSGRSNSLGNFFN